MLFVFVILFVAAELDRIDCMNGRLGFVGAWFPGTETVAGEGANGHDIRMGLHGVAGLEAMEAAQRALDG
jgi:hypothetical protein